MRLNKELREAIIENALAASSIEADTKALSIRSRELSNRVRLDSLGGVEVEQNMLAVEKEIAMLMDRRGIPKALIVNQAFERTTNMYANIPGGTHTFQFSGAIGVRHGTDLPPVDYSSNNLKLCGERKDYAADHEFVIERNAILNEWKVVCDRKVRILREARAVVESFNTTEKLIEHWPEAEALLPKEKVSKPMPLSTNVSTLNSLIGLPK